jgi:PRTRC genetic system protein A
MKQLVNYLIADRESSAIGPDSKYDIAPGTLYEYVFAANGTFVHAKNEIMDVFMPLAIIREEGKMIRGLRTLEPRIRLPKRVPAMDLRYMTHVAQAASPNEILFYFRWINGEWEMDVPPQRSGHAAVQPLEDSDYVPIEVHSHNTMPAFFSVTDNRDENGLRIYGVLGRVDQPVVDFKLRISIYGHYSILPYQLVFEPWCEVKNG